MSDLGRTWYGVIPYPFRTAGDGAPVLSASDFVTFSPNPASTEVSVLSSTGIRQVQVFDITGRKVYDSGRDLQSPPSIVLPIAGWPNGTYTIHVDTPLGLAVKKLEKVE